MSLGQQGPVVFQRLSSPGPVLAASSSAWVRASCPPWVPREQGRTRPWTPGPPGNGGTGGGAGAGPVSTSVGSQPPDASASRSKVQARGGGCRPSQALGARRLCFTAALPTGRTKDILKRAPLGSQDRPEVGSQRGLCGPSERPRLQTRFRTDHSAYAKERPRLPGVFPSLPQSQEGLAMWQEGWGSSLPSRARAEGQRTATDASGHWVRGPEQGQA